MILYLDTSSLLKLFLAEPGADLVRSWAADAEALTTSRIAYTEGVAGLARRSRDGSLSARGFAEVLEQFQSRWPVFLPISLDEHRAGDLAIKHPLRSLDAIHLAAALAVRARLAADVLAFTSFDSRLNAAAAAEGLRVLGDG